MGESVRLSGGVISCISRLNRRKYRRISVSWKMTQVVPYAVTKHTLRPDSALVTQCR